MKSTLIESWLKRESITLGKNSDTVDTHLYTSDEINPIVQKYAIYSKAEVENVSVGDIYGVAIDSQIIFQGIGEDIISALEVLFSTEGEEYNIRANSLLDIPKNNIINELGESFIKDPIRIDEVEEEKYVINGNGKHRYVLLRCLYLDELSKIDINDKNAIQKLKEKYRIPTVVSKVDLKKTYINMFLMTFGFNKIRSVSFNSSLFDKEGIEIEHMGEGFFSNARSFIPDDELMGYISNLIRVNQNIVNEKELFYKADDKKHNLRVKNILFIRNLPKYFREIQSFREFVVENLSEVFLEDPVKQNIGIDVINYQGIKSAKSIIDIKRSTNQMSDPND